MNLQFSISISGEPALDKAGPSRDSTAVLRSLYDMHSRALQSYNTLIWAHPFAFIALVLTEIEKLRETTWCLIVAAIFNFLMLYAFSRHLKFRSEILNCLNNTQLLLREELARSYPNKHLVPFEDPRSDNPLKAATLIFYMQFIIGVLFSVHVLNQIMLPSKNASPLADLQPSKTNIVSGDLTRSNSLELPRMTR